jgi:phage terminase large subunit-like protein
MLKKPAEFTPEKAALYKKDIMLFLEEQYICPETGKLIVLEEWQKELILKPLFYDLLPDGRRKYTLALLGMPKKHGKSTLAAGIGVWFCFAGEPHGEVIIAANNLDQASLIIYEKIRQAFKLNPNLLASARLLKTGIEMRGTGTVCRPIAHKYQTAAGVNPTLVLFDELWGFEGREFYDELTTSPARKNPLGLIVTYAGYDKDSLLYSLYKQGKKGEDPKMFYLWFHDTKASWISQEYLDTQKRRLPPNSYARFHENRWAAAEGTFVTEADVQRLHAVPWTIQYMPDQSRPLLEYVVACDAGLSHDRTARSVVHYDPNDGRVYIDSMRWWEGTKSKHVDMAEVEADLKDTANRFKCRRMVIDPWQMEYVMQRLKPYFTIEPFNFNADMMFLSQTLITMLRNGTLVGYNEPELDKELREIIAKQTGQGWRIEHVRGKRNDLVISLGMAVVAAVRNAGLSEFSFIEDKHPIPPVGFKGIRQKEF